MSAGLGLAWAGLVLWCATDHRPPPGRVVSLSRSRTGAVAGPARDRRTALEVLGGALLRLAHRPVRPPERARTVGAVAVLTVVCGLTAPVLLPAPTLGAWVVTRLATRREECRRLGAFEADLPETVDLLTLAVGAGCNVALAVAAAGRRGAGPLAAELCAVTDAVSRGRRLADALDDLPARAGEGVRPLSSALVACERYGAPLEASLQRVGDHVRRQRRRRAEEAARKVPVALLFPLVLCILPAFALLTVAPLVAGALRELRL